ncbi:hypothetical protein HOD20_00450 [archaeon]|jgi:hypothetical protein|nr:hypothetical protein [archaeon]MBT4350972.1 hypothetical protein [archaeon]MBT4647663.1 hypothetical protein [archaeon]MBT6822222.1 hypothetical protein [archaeon]MBT7391483.1 hypothetical protein [archaeon]
MAKAKGPEAPKLPKHDKIGRFGSHEDYGDHVKANAAVTDMTNPLLALKEYRYLVENPTVLSGKRNFFDFELSDLIKDHFYEPKSDDLKKAREKGSMPLALKGENKVEREKNAKAFIDNLGKFMLLDGKEGYKDKLGDLGTDDLREIYSQRIGKFLGGEVNYQTLIDDLVDNYKDISQTGLYDKIKKELPDYLSTKRLNTLGQKIANSGQHEKLGDTLEELIGGEAKAHGYSVRKMTHTEKWTATKQYLANKNSMANHLGNTPSIHSGQAEIYKEKKGK